MLITASGQLELDDLYSTLKEKDSEYTKDDLMMAITFLFALGKVVYCSKTNMVSLTHTGSEIC